MSISDCISLGLAITTGLLSVVSVILVILTLCQNKHMIENATRPYLVLYPAMTDFGTVVMYLIVRNYGQSSAQITGFSTDTDLSKAVFMERFPIPFEHIVGTTIAPNQAIRFPIEHWKLRKVKECPSFTICYKSGKKTYQEKVTISFKAMDDQLFIHAKEGEDGQPSIQTISRTLQDFTVSHL